ncbi:hypothetical protein ACLOJK_009931 [Asimina triloba]
MEIARMVEIIWDDDSTKAGPAIFAKFLRELLSSYLVLSLFFLLLLPAHVFVGFLIKLAVGYNGRGAEEERVLRAGINNIRWQARI